MTRTERPWYEVYVRENGRDHTCGVTQSRHQARKLAKEFGGKTRRIPTPKAVVK